ncbi:hypothetical protein MUK42_29181 [Musa troglodytarum]|uniref:Uncharacterized protein n=1 Tax=Musa troglodytarum TaxID=320322 RepID=A0A9E7FLK2_9LILI|nr:hypothetical protein MUK42_29181 [Musa troglodytarum]
MGRDQPEKPAERDGGGVAAGENEVEHHMLEKRVAVAVDVLDAARERGLHPDLEPLLEPPNELGEDEAVEAGLGGAVEGDGEGVLREVGCERLRVLAEGEAAYVVKGEPEEQILEVDDRGPGGSFFEDGKKAEVDGTADPLRHGDSERASGELQCSSLALEEPGISIGVEDAVAKEVQEDGVPCRALRVVVEPGLEHMLEVARVAGDRHHPLPASEAGDGANAGLVGAAGATEVVRDPLMHALRVLDQAREAAQHRPHPRPAKPRRQPREPHYVGRHACNHHQHRRHVHLASPLYACTHRHPLKKEQDVLKSTEEA